MTFTPVSNISAVVACSSNAGAGRWIGSFFFALIGPKLVDRLPDDVHHAPKRLATHWNADRPAHIDGFHTAHHAVGRLHGDAPHAAFAEMLLHFEHHVDRRRNGEALADDANSFVDGRQMIRRELHVHGGTGDLNYVSNILAIEESSVLLLLQRLHR